MKNGKAKRIASLLLTAAVCFAMLFSLCVVVSSHHDCTGDGCRICAQLNNIENLLRTLICTAVVFAAVACTVFSLNGIAGRVTVHDTACTLFSLRVLLLN